MSQKKSGAMAVFVKTPGYSPVKTRLAASLGVKAAESFHLASAYSVAAIMQASSRLMGVQCFFAIAEKAAFHSPLWKIV